MFKVLSLFQHFSSFFWEGDAEGFSVTVSPHAALINSFYKVILTEINSASGTLGEEAGSSWTGRPLQNNVVMFPGNHGRQSGLMWFTLMSWGCTEAAGIIQVLSLDSHSSGPCLGGNQMDSVWDDFQSSCLTEAQASGLHPGSGSEPPPPTISYC